MCVRIWFLRFPAVVNDFLQWSHWKGFSPVCVRECTFSCWAVTKDLSQPSLGHLKFLVFLKIKIDIFKCVCKILKFYNENRQLVFYFLQSSIGKSWIQVKKWDSEKFIKIQSLITDVLWNLQYNERHEHIKKLFFNSEYKMYHLHSVFQTKKANLIQKGNGYCIRKFTV